MTDGELRGIVLKKFYEVRNEPGMFSAVASPDLQAIEPNQYRLFSACKQLHEHGLISGQIVETFNTFGYMGSITAHGVDVLEGNVRTSATITQGPKATVSQSQGVQSNALRLLKAIYEKTHDQTSPVDDVARLSTGLSEEEAKAAWRYLRDKALIQTFNLDYAARINSNGVDVIEKLSSPAQQASTHSTLDQALTRDRGMGVREQVASGMKAPTIRKILFLSSNPTNTGRLRLDKEVREIAGGLKRSNERDRFTLISSFATRVEDLRRNLLDHSPQIVHFAGHDGTDGIVIEKDNGEAFQVPNDALADLFGLCVDQIECVILNACYSAVQVDAIVKHIPYVIGMSGAVSDTAAIEFAVGFYDALGAGKSIEVAFEFGRNAVALKGIPEHLTPVLKKCTGAVREPPSVGTSFDPFLSRGPGDNADWALVFRILNSGRQDVTIRRAVYFLDSEKRVPILADAKHSQVHPEGFEVKFGEQWKLLECFLKPGEEALSYVPLQNQVSAFELPQGVRGELLLEYEIDGRPGSHRAVL